MAIEKIIRDTTPNRIPTDVNIIIYKSESIPVEYMIAVLLEVFDKTEEEALYIVTEAFLEGSAIVTHTGFIRAMDLIASVNLINTEFDYSLKITIE